MNLRDQLLDVECIVETKKTGSRLDLIDESTDALLSHSSSDLLFAQRRACRESCWDVLTYVPSWQFFS